MSDLFSLTGRVALVTGASRGLGWAMAEAMARHGATVLLNARGHVALEGRAAELHAAGLKAEAAPFDVADPSAVTRAVAGIVARHGRLDILVNNAGIQHRVPLTEWQDEDWERVIATNLTACFRLAREAARPMLAQRSGRIIMVGSAVATLARPTIHGYVAAKGGLQALTRSLAAELGRKASRSTPSRPASSAPSSTRRCSTTPSSPPGCRAARRSGAGATRRSSAAPPSSSPRRPPPT
jgi:gluconate 5-dehydrogenase